MLLSSAYISAARRLSPTVPRELEEYIASAYSSIRQEEAKSTTPHSYTTVRTLLSILRISAVSPFSFAYIFLLIIFLSLAVAYNLSSYEVKESSSRAIWVIWIFLCCGVFFGGGVNDLCA